METLSFAFGVLSIIGLLFVIIIVIGAVKVNKQQNQIKNLEQWLTEAERNLYQQMCENKEASSKTITQLYQYIDKTYSESISYTDSRLDKLESKLTTDKLASGLRPERVKKLIQG